MYSLSAFVCVILAVSTPLAAAAPVPEPEGLETRQSAVIKFYADASYSGRWADMAIENVGQCEQIPTAVKDKVSSFKLGVYNCRFFEHDNCQGANQWFDHDNSNLKKPAGWGYKGNQNDEFSSAMCWLKPI